MRPFEKFHAYCDESGTADRYTVIGVLFCHSNVAPKFTKWLEEIAQSTTKSDDMKWTKVKKHNLQSYITFTDTLWKAIGKNYVTFHCMVIDNSQMNHKLYNEGDKELGFNKMLFQALYVLARTYRSRPRFYVYLDERTTKHSPERLRLMLNGRARKNGISHAPYRVCQFRKSEEERLIQLTDVVIGALCYRINRKHLEPDAAGYKVALSEHIVTRSGLKSVRRSNEASGFTLWHIDLLAYAKGVPRL